MLCVEALWVLSYAEGCWRREGRRRGEGRAPWEEEEVAVEAAERRGEVPVFAEWGREGGREGEKREGRVPWEEGEEEVAVGAVEKRGEVPVFAGWGREGGREGEKREGRVPWWEGEVWAVAVVAVVERR